MDLRSLNRATLARQLLLERDAIPATEAIKRVAGLQAQVVNPPYIGLWSRLTRFDRAELTTAIQRRDVVRATLMRSTLHLVTARDYLALRTPLQPALTRGLRSFHGKNIAGLDVEAVADAARERFEDGPTTFAELRAALAERHPGWMPEALAFIARAELAIVQVAPAGTWRRGGEVRYALAHEYLGAPVNSDPDPAALVRRHLAAFGPATVKDVQAWAGMAGLKSKLPDDLEELGDGHLDLPGAPRPPADTPAPPRFLPEYDTLVLSHADRSRVIADEHKPKVFLSAGRVRATFLLDGFVAGTWKVDNGHVVVEPFTKLGRDEKAALATEAAELERWLADEDDRVASA